ncbi:PREDICTED: yjeF N-terminal domain-containing protein 3-like, partial [Poecilia mexicana]|uniref:yjeF N-terminal domain-containing protein 3-like n=1 Tax=Poecilia mexicana TaxID=48701 RepID=UPI00072EE9CC
TSCLIFFFSFSKGDAAAIETELLRDYKFGQQQLIELWGQACALAITKAYPLSALSKKQPTVLVICGPDQNGSIGLVCARHLRIFDYEPTVYHPKRSSHSLHQDFTIQCEKMDIPFLSYLPTEVSSRLTEYILQDLQPCPTKLFSICGYSWFSLKLISNPVHVWVVLRLPLSKTATIITTATITVTTTNTTNTTTAAAATAHHISLLFLIKFLN